MLDLNKASSLAKKWALEVGQIQRERFKESDFETTTKSSSADLVTEVDILSENMIKNNIEKEYPEHNIIGEEQGDRKKASDYTWIIDPLDGSNNYSMGYPIYGISIALKFKDQIVMGVIYLPEQDEIYSAIKNKGAFRGSEVIKVAEKKELEQATVSTGFPYDKKDSELDNLLPFSKIVKNSRGVRRSGSAAFDLISVACGRTDLFWEFKLAEWDIAAAKIIIKEAGGTVFEAQVKAAPLIIVANRKLVEIVKSIISELYQLENESYL
ncbi:inositol monophosphatase [Halanaerobium sp. Z-7514]|uniref:Inositol-1-monophosphatase n=1 Tax=Halanaerobium polyolivorans TaxID=2886943 RepID=A0AAW4WSL6_9FIRM|nr:inositol monophosphatase family protein [Halanaerobium polyolivorans]MCC3144085.1 inositol monophosphatase [Halanaerobium polyolivorans]